VADKKQHLHRLKHLVLIAIKVLPLKTVCLYFDTSLAPERSGFGSVGVAAPGQVQMTPYYGDVTGAYRLTQEQFGGAYKAGAGTKNSDELLRIMRQNEIKGLVDSGMSVADATAQIDGKAGGAGGASGSAGAGCQNK
jgi:hypothetical protein